MARVEKNAAGEDVPVDTPEFGCITITPDAPPAPKTKAAAKAAAPEGESE